MSEQRQTTRRISIFDSTLRDGEQAPGNGMSPDEKVELALMIEDIGVDFIEIGFPASSDADFEAARLLSKSLTRASYVSFCRALHRDIEVALEAAGVGSRHSIQILSTGSDIHLQHKRNITRTASIDETVNAVAFTRSLGIGMVSVGVEDASRGDPAYLKDLVTASVDAGACNIVIADTTGYSTPYQYGALISQVRSWLPSHVNLATHCHDDFGLSMANAVAGLMAGADEVQVTLGGVGERAGNTPLEEILALLHYKRDELGLHCHARLDRLYAAYRKLRDIIQLEEPRNKAIFGKYAFGTAAGIHQQGMLKNPETYEYVEPRLFGRSRSLLIARHSGRAMLRFILDQIGRPLPDERLEQLYQKYIAGRSGGDCEDLSVLQNKIRQDLAMDELVGEGLEG